jgi:hypothetical protein
MSTVTAPHHELSAEAIRLINDIWDYLEMLKKRHIGEEQLFLLKEVILRDGEVTDEATLRSIRLKLKEKWDKGAVTTKKPSPKDGGEGTYDIE